MTPLEQALALLDEAGWLLQRGSSATWNWHPKQQAWFKALRALEKRIESNT